MSEKEKTFLADAKWVIENCPPPNLTIEWNVLVVLVAGLQLSLRHPHYPSTSRAVVRAWVDGIIAGIDVIRPSLAAVMRLGDDPAHDVLRTPEPTLRSVRQTDAEGNIYLSPLLHVKALFGRVWTRLAMYGFVDELHSAEFYRVRSEYLGSDALERAMEESIKALANRPSPPRSGE